ncbi:2Fe-2S iron-sulfur cluster-binding protein [Pelomonas sp. SE-A7]|uniref:2Fe-2S iron-sulfur cluster-binding protein n=1 Tax=Pelomonas sp. SE-A7 TaxID=3054953 RepID=UPI00259C6C41|nr:2Fe-2S iron-sulfur cluster-binding protein [Pelomonas sp. SE-A7]MDM4768303.1 2Fe-2S iron-sulfur cluster-binding protein [Pelomonas sp. SE-A7]
MRKIHKWIGLLIGLQFVLWMCSGFVMSLLDAEKVRGREFRAPVAAKKPWPSDARPVSGLLTVAREPSQTVSTGWLVDRPVYRLVGEKATQLIDARSGQRVELDAALAQSLAEASYRGPGKAVQAELVDRSLETRAHEGKVWRVGFSDAEDTTVYLSLQGDVLEHRNKTWRLFDVFWMLHIMDYSGRQDFNNPLVVSAAVGGFWLALSGIWLLFTSFSLAEFIPKRWRGTRALMVHAPDGSRLRSLRAHAGDTVFVALAQQGLQLPSNCGGGQTCGLCEVRVRGSAPEATSSDRALLSPSRIEAGCRLACNLKLDRNLDIEVRGGADFGAVHEAEVESVRALSPFLREVVLLPKNKPGPDYRPGSFIQVHVPAYKMGKHQIEAPDEHRSAWSGLHLPAQWTSGALLRRSYSLSAPVQQTDGRLTLLVRFCHGKQGSKNHPPGKGSAFVFGLKAGDKLQYSGPFGDFAIQHGEREKVFIGGGAGMAPLRAMVRDLLESGADEPIHFWYGARNLADAPYVEEMEALATRFDNFSWQLVLSEERGAERPSGMVHDAVREGMLQMHPDLQACDFYLCGPPPMLTATRAMLKKLGVQDDRVAFDDFKI